MKNTVLIILLWATSFNYAQVKTNQTVNKEARDSINFTVSKLMDFYDSYDDGSPESIKKTRFDKAVDALPNSNASEKDKADGYKIVNAYILGDKALEQDKVQQTKNNESLEDAIENSKESKEAQEYLDQQKDMLMQMSYTEFEAYVLKISPTVSKKDIKEAYNRLHQNDGKQVSITSEDDVMTEAQLQMWAIETIQNPKSCADYRKAIQILKMQIPEDIIQKECQKLPN